MPDLNKVMQFITPLALGTVAFFLVVGPLALNPLNIAWLMDDYDPTQHFLAWDFFRHHPWTFPVGLNPSFGLELSSSILYADLIPALAIFFKIFSGVLPEPFQYFGIWYLICFILQAYFAWLLVGLCADKFWVRLCGSGLLLFSPIMFWRIGIHAALAGHFLVLAALWLNLRPYSYGQTWRWTVLLVLAGLIQPYILGMLLPLWLADLTDRSLALRAQGSPTRRTNFTYKLVIEVGIVLLSLVLFLWQAGLFEVKLGGSATGEYGSPLFVFNLLGFFNAQGWSYILPNIGMPTNFDGYAYFGLGGIIALLGAAYLTVRKGQVFFWRGHFFFIFTLVGLAVFAISNHVMIGNLELEIPISKNLQQLASVFRGSGRMIWPAYYFLILLFIFNICKLTSEKLAVVILAFCFLVQVGDTSAGWLAKRRHKLMLPRTSSFQLPLVNPFWAEAAKHYKKIVHRNYSTDPKTYNIGWSLLAKYAAQYHLATNSVWLSRYDAVQRNNMEKRYNEALARGQFDSDTLYVIKDDEVYKVLWHIDSKKDLFGRIDGINVVAPGWLNCKTCLPISFDQDLSQLLHEPGVRNTHYFDRSRLSPYVLSMGWSNPEAWGTWSDGQYASLSFLVPKNSVHELTLKIQAFIPQGHPQQVIDVMVGGNMLKTITLSKPDQNTINIPLNQVDLDAGFLQIYFRFHNPVRPSDIGMGDDKRLLAIGLISATFH